VIRIKLIAALIVIAHHMAIRFGPLLSKSKCKLGEDVPLIGFMVMVMIMLQFNYPLGNKNKYKMIGVRERRNGGSGRPQFD
jgi:hypothetical protein